MRGAREVFGRWGRTPRAMILDNTTEAGGRLHGTVVESMLFSQFRGGHCRFEARFRDPYSGNEKGSMENAAGFLRRNLLIPVPAVGSMADLNAMLADGCARPRASSSCRDGLPTAEAPREDLAGMLAPPGVAFDAVRWARAKADKRGYARVDGREYAAGRHWRGGELLVGVRPSVVEALPGRGRRAAVTPHSFGEGPAVRDPMSPLPALVARPRAFGESTIRRDMPGALVAGIDRTDGAGRRQALRAIGRTGAASGFEAACLAAERVVEGGRAPGDATVDVPSGRTAADSGKRIAADLSPCGGFLKGAVGDDR